MLCAASVAICAGRTQTLAIIDCHAGQANKIAVDSRDGSEGLFIVPAMHGYGHDRKVDRFDCMVQDGHVWRLDECGCVVEACYQFQIEPQQSKILQ